MRKITSFKKLKKNVPTFICITKIVQIQRSIWLFFYFYLFNIDSWNFLITEYTRVLGEHEFALEIYFACITSHLTKARLRLSNHDLLTTNRIPEASDMVSYRGSISRAGPCERGNWPWIIVLQYNKRVDTRLHEEPLADAGIRNEVVSNR